MSLIIAQAGRAAVPVEESVSVCTCRFDSSPFVYLWLPPPLLNVPREQSQMRVCMTYNQQSAQGGVSTE